MEQDDQKQKAEADRCKNRPERKVCRCGSGRESRKESRQESRQESRRESRTSRRESRKGCRTTRKQILSQNPFIIYYLELYYKNPNKHITEVARQAGKEWCAMSPEDKQKYICLAERVRRRRRRKSSKRRRGC